jgi:hypothetical protein
VFVGGLIIGIVSIDCVAQGKTGAEGCGDGSAVSGIVFCLIMMAGGLTIWACATKFGTYGCCCCCSGLQLKCSKRDVSIYLDDDGFNQARATHTRQVQEVQKKIAAESQITFVVKSASGQQINLTTAKSTTVVLVAHTLGVEKMMLGSVDLIGSETLDSQAVMDGTILTAPAFQITTLPVGWEARLADGKLFYVNHILKTSEWELPIPQPTTQPAIDLNPPQALKVLSCAEIQLAALEVSVPNESHFQRTDETCACAPGVEFESIDWDETKWCLYLDFDCSI